MNSEFFLWIQLSLIRNIWKWHFFKQFFKKVKYTNLNKFSIELRRVFFVIKLKVNKIENWPWSLDQLFDHGQTWLPANTIFFLLFLWCFIISWYFVLCQGSLSINPNFSESYCEYGIQSWVQDPGYNSFNKNLKLSVSSDGSIPILCWI